MKIYDLGVGAHDRITALGNGGHDRLVMTIAEAPYSHYTNLLDAKYY